MVFSKLAEFVSSASSRLSTPKTSAAPYKSGLPPASGSPHAYKRRRFKCLLKFSLPRFYNITWNMDRKENQTPQGEIAQILVEFLEVAITSVVFLKGVYPNGAFERRRFMNLVVHKATNPQLYEYIHVAVNGLLPFLTKDLIDRVSVVFLDDGGLPIERFVFRLNVNQSYDSMVQQADMELSLRSFLIKLPLSEALTKALPHNCRWEITAYFRTLPDCSTSKSAETWVPSDVKQWQQPPVITPIKSMSSEPLCLQVYAEDPMPKN